MWYDGILSLGIKSLVLSALYFWKVTVIKMVSQRSIIVLTPTEQ